MKARTKQSQALLSMSLLAFGGAFAACQGLADVHTSAPPLASIHGTLSLGSNAAAPTGDVKLAILWDDLASPQPSADTRDPSNPCAVDPLKLAKNPDNVGGVDFPDEVGYNQFRRISSAQQVGLATTFPVEFTLNIVDPPPPAALRTLEPHYGSSQYGSGQLVVYRDANANGRLDLSTFEQPSPDELLSASSQQAGVSYTIDYADRKPVFDLETARRDGLLSPHESASPWDQAYAGVEAGYNLIAWDKRPDSSASTRLSDADSVALELNPTPTLQMQLCEQVCTKPDDLVCPADPRDLPPNPEQAADSQGATWSSWLYFENARTVRLDLSCFELSSGRRYWEYRNFACEGCACALRECAYWGDELPDGASLPCGAYQTTDYVPLGRAFSH